MRKYAMRVTLDLNESQKKVLEKIIEDSGNSKAQVFRNALFVLNSHINKINQGYELIYRDTKTGKEIKYDILGF